MASSSSPTRVLFFLALAGLVGVATGSVGLGARLVAKENRAWVSENGTFAFGFSPVESDDRYQLGIWFEQLPGDRTMVWSASRNSPVGKDAVLELDSTGNLLLLDGDATVWSSNTSGEGVETAYMSESGNFILYNGTNFPLWQSFSHPSDTLLPNQPLTASMELTSSSPAHGGYYTLQMLQQPTSLSLGLIYNLPDSYITSLQSYANYSYWSGPDISNVTGDVVAVLDEAGSFGIMYGSSSDGAVYVYKSDTDEKGLSSSVNQTVRPLVLRRLILEMNGNLRLYRWDDDVNGTRQWVPEWAAVSNPCDIAGVCGNGVCSLDRSKTNASCTCLPGASKLGDSGQCSENSSVSAGKCDNNHRNSTASKLKMSIVQQTNYYYPESSIIANYSNMSPLSQCGDACLSDCDCVASVYGLSEEKPYCWLLNSLEFGGFEDTSSTLFVKVGPNGSPEGNATGSGDSSDGLRDKVLVLPIVLSITVLVGLLCLLLYHSVYRRALKRALESSLIVSGAPMNLSYRDLQRRTGNLHRVWECIQDGTLVAVKKLDKPLGKKEFITEVPTIGSMHRMNLVRLCGYCSEGSHQLLVYEFMKNGFLDKWIFPSKHCRDRLLDWGTRFHIAIATAQGIAYFHEQCRNRIIHCDIKPENILLDENFCPKVLDFGLAKLMGREH